jgi:Tetrahydrofolate dehydrogenase/cyclohydrolase, NAD(P)-binding domain
MTKPLSREHTNHLLCQHSELFYYLPVVSVLVSLVKEVTAYKRTCIDCLLYYYVRCCLKGIATIGKNAVVCGRSKNVGLPIALLLHASGIVSAEACTWISFI